MSKKGNNVQQSKVLSDQTRFTMGIQTDQDAYKTEFGPVLLLAGPGTGKTFQIAKRIQYLTTEKNISPNEITVITFTYEAAASMRRKIEEVGGAEYIDPEKRPGRISTMHSLGQTILLDKPEAFGIDKNFQVVEDQITRQILMNDAAMLRNSNLENAVIALKERTTAKASKTCEQITDMYEKILRSCNAIDYDDQITLACELLKDNDDLRRKYSAKSKYLLVDEYQDINPAQFELIKLLSSEYQQGLFVVGDDDQSIYSFRGGSPDYIRNFEKDFGSKCNILSMNVSRRCLPNILDSAVSVVVNFDKKRLDKGDYKYLKTDHGLVVKHDCPSDDRESEIITYIISEKIKISKQAGEAAGSFFILVPNRFYVDKIQESLKRTGISADFKSASDFSGFRKIQILRRWFEGIKSNILLRYIMELIVNSGTVDLPSQRVRSKQKIDKRVDGLKKIASLWNSVINDGTSLFDSLEVASKTDSLYLKLFQRLKELQSLYLEKDIPNLLAKISLYVKPWNSTDTFFEEVEKLLFSSNGKGATNISGSSVRVLTFQSAKGLEADTVFIIGLEAENIPRGKDEQSIAEQARLLFVAMTRAINELHLFHCRKRTGSATLRPISRNLNASPFLDVLPSEKIEEKYHAPKSRLKSNKKTNV